MKPEQDIVVALRALGHADEAIEPSPELEIRVRGAFRAQKARRKWNRAAWTIAAAAAVLVIGMFIARRPRPVEQHAIQQSPTIAAPVEQPVPVSAPPKAQRARVARPRETVTEFFPLIDAPPPMDRGELFRVTVPAAAMRTVGLPVSEDRLADRVQADVLVSEDGLATAIRFVKNE